MRMPAAWFAIVSTIVPLALYAQVRFGSRSVGVVLDVAVLDNGKLVRGLTDADFEVLDSGVRQRIQVRETETTPLDIVLVLQPLQSLRPPAAILAERGINEVFDLLRAEDRVALLLASTPPTLTRTLTTLSTSRFESDAAAWRGTADVALWDSLFLGYRQFDRRDRRKVVLMFTNTDHDAGVLGPRDVARMAELQPAQLFFLVVDKTGPDPLGVTASIRPGPRGSATKSTSYFTAAVKWSLPEAIFDLARVTGGEVVDLREGRANLFLLFSYLRAEYLITFVPEGVSGDGWHELTVRLKGRSGKIVARPGYWATPTQTNR